MLDHAHLPAPQFKPAMQDRPNALHTLLTQQSPSHAKIQQSRMFHQTAPSPSPKQTFQPPEKTLTSVMFDALHLG